MTPFLIRAGQLITAPDAPVLSDAALLIRGDLIDRIAPWEGLRRDHPDLPVQGDERALVLPALINAHDHGRGLSTLGLGIPDDILEPWILSLMRLPPLPPRSDTRLSALRQLKGGIGTTVNSFYHPLADAQMLTQIRQGYEDAGLRAGLIHSAMDRPATGSLLRAALPGMAPALAGQVETLLAARTPFDMGRYERALRDTVTETGLSWMMAGVVSAHWSTDAQITRVAELSRELGLATQMHLLESRHQSRDNARFGPGGITRHLEELGALDDHASCAHCVQMGREDIATMARTGAAVVHNLSSNLRLRSGIAPVRAMLDAGVTVAMGLDSMGLNDSACMFQEMRLVHRLHGTLSAAEVLGMATTQAARALGLSARTGQLAPGMAADVLVLRDPVLPAPAMAGPDQAMTRIVLHADSRHVRQLFVAGRCVIEDGRHPDLDEDTLVAELCEGLCDGRPDAETGTDRFIREVLPALRAALAKG